ncbi:MAG TPA: SPOR domain-containing protein [Burkholderiaceae bacterium]
MLKFFFWLLLLANALAYAAHRGYLGELGTGEREPARLTAQLNADKIKMVPASVATAEPPPKAEPVPETPAPSPAPAVVAVQKPAVACYEIGTFTAPEAKKFETALAPLGLPGKIARVSTAEASSHMVYIPSLGSKDAADKKAAELRALGVENFFVMPDNTPLRWGISLGVFKTEQAAQNHLAALVKQGVRSARVAARLSSNTKISLQLRDLSAENKARVEKVRLGFPNQDTRLCK